MIGWLGDFFRFWWGLLYWNARKAAFRRQGPNATRSPCQNYSDSGRAFETRCDAALTWSKPERFQRLCPLLVSTPEGWRCSANTADVRPFWKPVFRSIGLALLTLFILGVIGSFGVLRYVGYRISPLAIIWPPRWHEIHQAREDVYATRAVRALNLGNFQTAILSLQLVCDLNPHNVAAGLTLAGLWQISNRSSLADGLYIRLARDNPEQQLVISQARYQSLLSRADYAAIKELSSQLLAIDEPQRGVWLHALFFAVRQTHDSQFLTDLLARQPNLPPWCLTLIQTEAALLADPHATVPLALLSTVADAASPYISYYQIDRLIALGRYDNAMELLVAYGSRINPDEAAYHRLRIFSARGWTSLAEIEFDNILSQPLTARQITLICTFLIGQPNRALLSRYFVSFVRNRVPLTAANYPLFSATFCAAAANGNWERADEIGSMLKQLTGSEAHSFRVLQAFFRKNESGKRINQMLPVIALPTEVSYALLGRYAPSEK